MKRKIKIFICFILLSAMLFSLCGCGYGHHIKNPRKNNPLTKEEITLCVKKKFYDDDGNVIKWYWENESIHYKAYKYSGEDITGFSVQFIKGLNGKREWFIVEFEPTGCVIGTIYDYYKNSDFLSYNPYRLFGVEDEDRYVIDKEYNGSNFVYCAIRRDDIIIPIDTILNDYLNDENYYNGYSRVYNVNSGEWVENVYIGFFDFETKTWITGKNNKK